VRDRLRAVVIDLDGAEYARLVIQVPDPEAAVTTLERALAA
jgi:hypothetical protein